MSATPKLTPKERAEAAILYERLSGDSNELERFIYSAVFIRAQLERELAAERERADRLEAALREICSEVAMPIYDAAGGLADSTEELAHDKYDMAAIARAALEK